ncbi:MAG: DUF167 domain-containing protein [Candidatus Omnitrophica bacterium]|nr:DUF167 domain-containing protein [Candidatus Omnitrophota bacterium]
MTEGAFIKAPSGYIKIRAIPNAKKNEITEFGGGYKVYLTAPPAEGKANKALIEFLAGHFNLKKGQLEIVKGPMSRDKVVRFL